MGPLAAGLAAVLVIAATTVLIVVKSVNPSTATGTPGVDPGASVPVATSSSPTTITTGRTTSTGPTSTTSSRTTSSTPPQPAALRIAVPDLPRTTEPLAEYSNGSRLVLHQVFDTLTSLASDQTAVVPGLATEWESNEAATEWTFRLRSGVKFHNGAALTAQSVCANFAHWSTMPQELREDAFDWTFYFGGFSDEQEMTYRNCAAAGTDVVRLNFAAAQPYLPAILAIPSFGIAAPGTFGRPTPIGTGPYRWSSATRDSVELVAVGSQGPRRLQFSAVSDQAALADLVDKGRADLAGPVVTPTRAMQDLLTFGAPSTVRMLMVNQKAGRPLADARLRQAVALAIDTNSLASILPGQQATGSTLPPVLTGGTPSPGAKADPAKAKQLIAATGKPAPTLSLAVRDYGSPVYRQESEQIAAMLRAVGFKVDLKVIGQAADMTKVYNGELPVDLFGVSFLPVGVDPIDFLTGITPGLDSATGADKAGWRAAVTARLAQVGKEIEPEQRTRAGVEIDEMLVANQAVIPLYTRANGWAIGDVSGVEPGPLGYFRLDLAEPR